MSAAERQARRRAKLRAAGLMPVTNLWLPPELHAQVKAYAATLYTPAKNSEDLEEPPDGEDPR